MKVYLCYYLKNKNGSIGSQINCVFPNLDDALFYLGELEKSDISFVIEYLYME